MASRELVMAAKSQDDYAQVYGRILEQGREKQIIHWVGKMFGDVVPLTSVQVVPSHLNTPPVTGLSSRVPA
jgi:hypothetical protein